MLALLCWHQQKGLLLQPGAKLFWEARFPFYGIIVHGSLSTALIFTFLGLFYCSPSGRVCNIERSSLSTCENGKRDQERGQEIGKDHVFSLRIIAFHQSPP